MDLSKGNGNANANGIVLNQCIKMCTLVSKASTERIYHLLTHDLGAKKDEYTYINLLNMYGQYQEMDKMMAIMEQLEKHDLLNVSHYNALFAAFLPINHNVNDNSDNENNRMNEILQFEGKILDKYLISNGSNVDDELKETGQSVCRMICNIFTEEMREKHGILPNMKTMMIMMRVLSYYGASDLTMQWYEMLSTLTSSGQLTVPTNDQLVSIYNSMIAAQLNDISLNLNLNLTMNIDDYLAHFRECFNLYDEMKQLMLSPRYSTTILMIHALRGCLTSTLTQLSESMALIDPNAVLNDSKNNGKSKKRRRKKVILEAIDKSLETLNLLKPILEKAVLSLDEIECDDIVNYGLVNDLQSPSILLKMAECHLLTMSCIDLYNGIIDQCAGQSQASVSASASAGSDLSERCEQLKQLQVSANHETVEGELSQFMENSLLRFADLNEYVLDLSAYQSVVARELDNFEQSLVFAVQAWVDCLSEEDSAKLTLKINDALAEEHPSLVEELKNLAETSTNGCLILVSS